MTVERAKEILGDRAEWELSNMKKALSMLQLLNTDEENERLEAIKVILKTKGTRNDCKKVYHQRLRKGIRRS
jgi:hypothetical protein